LSKSVITQLPANSVLPVAPAGKLGTGTSLPGSTMVWKASTGGFAVLWLLTLYFYYRKPKDIVPPQGLNGSASVGEKELLKQLQMDCQKGNASQARKNLARWIRNHAPQSMRGSMRDFGEACGDEALHKAIAELDIHGFTDSGPGAWSGDSLWATFKHWQRQSGRPRSAEKGDSPNLYPG
jgi:hypothetical protein